MSSRCNFYRGFLEELSGPRGVEAARNLGLALVGAGTLAMVITFLFMIRII